MMPCRSRRDQTGLAFPWGMLVNPGAVGRKRKTEGSWQESAPNSPGRTIRPPCIAGESAVNLEEETFATTVSAALSRNGVPPSRLKVEFTESALITHRALVLKNLGKLRDAGIACAIDDFGTGYSNLSYLKRFPVDCLTSSTS